VKINSPPNVVSSQLRRSNFSPPWNRFFRITQEQKLTAPVPFIVIYIRRIFQWMRRHMSRLDGMVDKLETKAHLKGQKVNRYKYLGLLLFVAIPLPGTGAWTGALAAAFLDMPLRKAMPSIILGVILAGCIMTGLTHLGFNLFTAVMA